MPVRTNLSLEEVQRLANSLQTEEAKLRTELSSLFARSQRDPAWTGNAAVKYDEYLQRWRQGQDQLLDALTGMAGELHKLAGNIMAIDQAGDRPDVTTFAADGFIAMKADIDQQITELTSSVLQRLAARSTWPEAGGLQPSDDYAAWAGAWRGEVSAVVESLRIVSAGLGQMIEIIGQVDADAAAALQMNA